tara:strand:- start:60 stop:581 length:522 start_codon:yes stop_codon:yes gene_type:complete
MVLKIAFGGKMGAGKDCAVKYCIKKYGGVHLSFAQPIYDILHYTQKLCGLEQTKDRKFLQFIGTEWGRDIDPNMWIKITIKNTPVDQNAFLSDLRFQNEFDSLKDNGWICVKLLREQLISRKGTGDLNHQSETELDTIPQNSWDFIIDNTESIKKFYEKLDTLIIKCQAKKQD